MQAPRNERARRLKVAASLLVAVGAVSATTIAKLLLLGGAMATAVVCSGCMPAATPTPTETGEPDNPLAPSPEATPTPTPGDGTVTDVSIAPPSAIVFPGDVVPFVATVNADASVTNRTVRWEILDAAVAQVDQAGTLTALTEGITGVIARSNANPNVFGTAPVVIVGENSAITYNITANKVTDTGCNFVPSFNGQLLISGTGTSHQISMQMVERLTRTYTSGLGQDGTFNGKGSGGFSAYQYTGTLIGKGSATAVSGTETLDFSTGCPGGSGQVAYQFNGTR
jgi:hypothetical protein